MSNYLNTYPACEAGSSLAALQYHIVRFSGARQVNLAIAPLSSGIAGVLQNKPGLGEFASVAYGGVSKVIAGGAITANDLIMTSTSGRAIVVTSGTAPANIVIGRALEAAGADGDIIKAFLFPPVRWAGAP